MQQNRFSKKPAFQKFNAETLGGVIASTGREYSLSLAYEVAQEMLGFISSIQVARIVNGEAYLRDDKDDPSHAVFVNMPSR